MIRPLILKASAAIACFATISASLFFVVAPAQAATISYTDPNCSSFSVTGTAPNFTLVCAKLVCSISASPSSPTPNQSVVLTANCSPVATGVTWTKIAGGASCPAAPSNTNPTTLVAPGTLVSGCGYQVDATNGAQGGQATITLAWSNTPPPAPTGCTLVASPTSLPVGGGAITLTASCSGGGAATSYAWTGNGLPTPTATNVSATSITTATTFTVTPSNAGGNGNTASVFVDVAGNATGNCGQFTHVLPMGTATWGQQSTWHSVDSGPFGDDTVWIFKLVVPANAPVSTVTGRFTVFEYGGPAVPRQITISPTACDFRTKDYKGATGPLALANGSTAEIAYGVSTPFIFGPAGLTAGQTYYISVRNWQLDPSPQSSCGGSNCAAGMNNIPATP